MHVSEAITGRQSIRAFQKDKPVTRDSIEAILATASRAPSGSNIQPWHVWVAMDAKRDEIANACQTRHIQGDQGKQEYNYYPVEWREPYISRRRNTGWGLYGHLGTGKITTSSTRQWHYFLPLTEIWNLAAGLTVACLYNQ